MSDLCEVETDGFIIFMEVLYGLVVTIGILANALVCSVFLSDIRIKNVSKLTITTCIYQNFSVISDIWLLIYQLQTQFIYFLHPVNTFIPTYLLAGQTQFQPLHWVVILLHHDIKGMVLARKELILATALRPGKK